jgi:putative pyruvate formate lyase activating enzyme
MRNQKNQMDLYKNCRLCPRNCGINRLRGELGFCKATADVAIAAYMAHRFEEPPISGNKGSGTIFFSFCTARCIYCQNFNFSRGKTKETVSISELSDIMLELQQKGCHNINLVTPTHYMPSIVEAIKEAKTNDLKIPIVYNTSGYETLEALDLLEGFIDIYLPDAKYSDHKLAKEHSGFIDYAKYNIPAIKRMYEQVGDLEVGSDGVAKKGLIVRHLVLPGYLKNTEGVLNALAKEVSNTIYISFMNQYSPIAGVKNHPNLSRRLTAEEYARAKNILHQLGFNNGWMQE